MHKILIRVVAIAISGSFSVLRADPPEDLKPQIRGVIVPLQEPTSSSAYQPLFADSPGTELQILQQDFLVEPLSESSSLQNPLLQISENEELPLSRWPEGFVNDPKDPLPISKIRGVVVPLPVSESTPAPVTEKNVEQKQPSLILQEIPVKEEESSTSIHKSSQTIIFSVSEDFDVIPIEVISENKGKKESTPKSPPMKRNVFANITIAALSAAVIFVSALLGSH